MEASIEVVRQYLKQVKVPTAYDKVYKDECMFTFDTPESPGGLYVNMSTFQAFGQQYVQLDQQRTGQHLYLHEQWTRVPLTEEQRAAQREKPTQLAVGGDAGFQVDVKPYTIEKVHKLVMLPEGVEVSLPCPALPELVLQAVNAIVAHDSASAQEKAAVWQEERRVSKYAPTLEQLDNGRVIPSDPSQWRCDETGVTENLWLNLSTGFIGSGRQHWDGTGGNGSALRHFEATGGKYPLVVKLGTITPHGADVYSYAPDEDDMVEDPLLAQHLAHWGINMLSMQKTEKSMAELQIDLNMAFEFDKITEAGASLKPLHGPGYVGLVNLGNSCYMNSVLQLLWTIPALQEKYVWTADALYTSAPAQPADDFLTQMAKVGVALTQGRTGAPPPLMGTGAPSSLSPQGGMAAVGGTHGHDMGGTHGQESTGGGVSVSGGSGGGSKEGVCVGGEVVGDGSGQASGVDTSGQGNAVRPQFFKALVGRGHSEFATPHQQDAVEYFQHLVELITRAEHTATTAGRLHGPPTSALFRFLLEDRIACVTSGCVRYKQGSSNVLGLPIPLDAAVNKQELEEYKDRQQKRAKLAESNAAAYISAADSGAGGDGGSGAGGVVVAKEREEPVIPRIPLAACIDKWSQEDDMQDYYSAAIQARGPAKKKQRFASYPPYLMVQLRRYYIADDWTARKLEVLVDVPESLNLTHLRSTGLQPHEQPQPADPEPTTTTTPAPAPPAADVGIVSAIVGMGFTEAGATRAAVAVGNSSVEAATEWVFAHMEDPDFNTPLGADTGGGGGDAGGTTGAHAGGTTSSNTPDAEHIMMLISMGFTDTQATAALQACGGNVERAADWLFNHTDDLDGAVREVLEGGAGGEGGGGGGEGGGVDDGPGLYELVGFVSHMGSNTACGHYVVHIKKEGRWVIYNDEKVAESAHPPTQLGYLYMYKRLEHLEQENGGTAAGNGAVSGQGGAVAVAGVDTVMQDT